MVPDYSFKNAYEYRHDENKYFVIELLSIYFHDTNTIIIFPIRQYNYAFSLTDNCWF